MDARPQPPVPEGFTVHRVLGEGSSAVVWLARYDVTGRQVALKVWRRGLDARSRSRFTEQCHWHQLLSDHRNIVDWVWASEPDAAYPWTATVPHGASLTAWLAEPHTFSARLQVACGMMDGLAAMHRHNLVHRDINPNNILVDAHDRAVLCDLGIAMPVTRMTADVGAGTPGFVAPELREGCDAPCYASDVYAAGRTLEAVLGHDLPDELERLVVRATSQRPSDRPIDAVEFASMLRAIAREADSGAQTPSVASPRTVEPDDTVTRPDVPYGDDTVPGRAAPGRDAKPARTPVFVPQNAAPETNAMRVRGSAAGGVRRKTLRRVGTVAFAFGAILGLVGPGLTGPNPPTATPRPGGSTTTSKHPGGSTTPKAVTKAFAEQSDIAKDDSPNMRAGRVPGRCGKSPSRVPVKDDEGAVFGEIRIAYEGGQACAKFVKSEGSRVYGKASFLAITLCDERGECDHDWNEYKVDAGPVRVITKTGCTYWRVSARAEDGSGWPVRNFRGSTGC